MTLTASAQWIRTKVGNEWRVVDHDLYLDTHQAIAAELRAKGLRPPELDHAIVAALPLRLALLLGGNVLH